MGNTRREHIIKRFLLAFILLALAIPLFQFTTAYFKEKPLNGVFVPRKKVYFSRQGWFDGSYQDSTNVWINENIGFRPDLIRARNQLYWWLSHKGRPQGIVVGKDDYLHDYTYIKAFTGEDFKGENHWQQQSASLKVLQDELKLRGVTLIVGLAPGKAGFYPETVPAEYGGEGKNTNYKSFSIALNKQGVLNIDFYKWFLQMKKTSPYPLYSKGGLHWSDYGATLVADSLIRFVETHTQQDLPDLKIKKVNWADTLSAADRDLYDLLNLTFRYNDKRMGYPEIVFEKPEGKKQPPLYVVADSYFWNVLSKGIAGNSFSHIKIDYYNKELHDTRNKFLWEYSDPLSVPFKPEEEKVLLLMCTEANLAKFPWGFIDKMEKDLGLSLNDIDIEGEISNIFGRMKKDEVWMKSLKEKAEKNKIPLDTVMRQDAIWILNQGK